MKLFLYDLRSSLDCESTYDSSFENLRKYGFSFEEI